MERFKITGIALHQILETVVILHFSSGKVYSLNKDDFLKAYYACAITALFKARYVYIQA